MCCLIEPEWEIEGIEGPDSAKRVLKVLEPDAGKLARPVLRGGGHGNVTFLPDRICDLWDLYRIKAIVDIKNMWKDGEKTRLLKNEKIKNVTYDYKGTVFCHCPKTGEIRPMSYGGFEAKRKTLKYTCPALALGVECKGATECPLFKKSIRIPLKEDRRIFTPVARSSYKWKTLYDKRTSAERVNSRIDVSFGFERHYIRGLSKMRLRCGLALSVMLAIAVGRLRQNRPELMRSLVKAA
jgi:hypothetical protein